MLSSQAAVLTASSWPLQEAWCPATGCLVTRGRFRITTVSFANRRNQACVLTVSTASRARRKLLVSVKKHACLLRAHSKIPRWACMTLTHYPATPDPLRGYRAILGPYQDAILSQAGQILAVFTFPENIHVLISLFFRPDLSQPWIFIDHSISPLH